MFQVYYGTGAIGVTRFMDVYHIKSVKGRTGWSEAVPIRSGIWCGAAKGLTTIQTSGGWRLVATFGEWRVPAVPGEGVLDSHVYYSDDNGLTWTEADYADGKPLYAPVRDDFNGANYGAIEGSIVERAPGLLSIYMRTQTGSIYEALSTDCGSTWSAAAPSPLRGSSSPAYVIRLSDSRLVAFWCNQPQLPLMEAAGGGAIGIYSGRDALHGAISDDGGTTWSGYRELLLDPRRNETPIKGDVGVAYPSAVELADGTIFLTTGQGISRAMLRFAPDWLCETKRSDSFTSGLLDWSTYTVHGLDGETQGLGKKPPRTEGACLVDHPDRAGAQSLHIRKADPEKPADGATWNFPGGNGVRGKLHLRVKFNSGFQGAWISLNDAFYDPWYLDGEKNAVFQLTIGPEGQIDGGSRLELDQWLDLAFAWDRDEGRCQVALDGGRTLAVLQQKNRGCDGTPICYLRLKSGAVGALPDTNGFMADSVWAATGV
ncbi:sialidase family protein [Paenibacillus sp. GCM10012303]|uniref:sialidase family protein n=1 Tax=Paenibacillus sp. GCM10012303 TaxID=3317340 RepID=UPI0036231E8E